MRESGHLPSRKVLSRSLSLSLSLSGRPRAGDPAGSTGRTRSDVPPSNEAGSTAIRRQVSRLARQALAKTHSASEADATTCGRERVSPCRSLRATPRAREGRAGHQTARANPNKRLLCGQRMTPPKGPTAALRRPPRSAALCRGRKAPNGVRAKAAKLCEGPAGQDQRATATRIVARGAPKLSGAHWQATPGTALCRGREAPKESAKRARKGS